MRRVLLLLFLLSLVLTTSAQEGTTITWSIEGVADLPSLDPATTNDSQGFMVSHLLFGGLVRLDKRLRVVPDLAEFWTISPDGLTYEFILREDSAFSDGSPVTAQDVVWSLTHALDPSTGAWTGGFLLSNIAGADELLSGQTTELSGVVVIDERTVQISIKRPSAYFLNQLTFGPARISSSANASADPNWGQNPVSSGAFAIQEWRRGEALILAPNPNYWQPAEQISELIVRFTPDSQTSYQAFIDGNVDITGHSQNPIPFDRVAEVENTPDFRTTQGFNMRYVGFNNEIAPFNDVRVRRAFALATDRATLADVNLGGRVFAADRILPPGVPGSELPVNGVPFDPDAARALLAEAGIDPASLNLTLTFGLEGDNERVVTALQQMWQENLGVNVALNPLELSEFSNLLNTTYEDPANGVQMYYSVWGSVYPDPQYFLSQVLRSGVGNNNGHFSNAQFDTLVDEADVITTDFEGRMQLYNQAEQIAVDEVGWLPLFNTQVNVLVRSCIEGITVTGLFSAFVISDYGDLKGCS